MSDLPERIRAFIAVPVPEVVRAQLADFQLRLKRELREVSWTRPDAMHLTLRFLGNLDATRIAELERALRQATDDLAAFELSLGEPGNFGNRVIWIGVGPGAEPLAALAERVRTAVEPYSGHEEERAFSAHITLGRIRQPTRGVAVALRNLKAPRFDPWVADHFDLIRSELSPRGSRYTTLSSFPLTAGQRR